ncbi:MAG: preprotein translocase subunit SecA [Oscillospiraceae bacterium]
MGLLDKVFGSYSQRELKKIEPIKDIVLSLESKYQAMTDDELKACTPDFRKRLENGETMDDILPEAFAACREASWRVLGMKPFPVQVIGGIVLHQGRIAEMRTGEGKTLVATLPAYLNALTGNGVHVVTVNDYLAKYQSESMGKIYRFMGLSIGLNISGMENDAKRKAYDADITYGTNNEFGFDYLRDNMVSYKENLVQRKHSFAIVDEVDSILIDEARTPLIISQPGEKSTDLYKIADKFAKGLQYIKIKETNDKELNDDVDADYVIDEKGKRATLTARGVEKAEQYFNIENLTDPENSTISHHINQAIRANGIMVRDVDYVVNEGEIIIVDEFTGRLMIGRRYNEGLHQAIEAKENVDVQKESKTLATITFQNYFRMYNKLSGMTGTAMTEDNEFREIYKLDVIEIPTNMPIMRNDREDSIYKTEPAKYKAICEQVEECHAKGQPVLVGTISIDKSENISNMLKRRGIKHEVLNAKYHEKEAEIVAQAGKYGAVTIATNMAGRGTDIMLGGNAEFLAKAQMRKMGMSDELIYDATSYADTNDEEIITARKTFRELENKFKETIDVEAKKVCEAGGLFIIGTERHESRRIDNQLRGRAGRQGDPGETKFFLSLQDELMRLFGGERLESMMNNLKIDEDMPIEAKMLSSSIETAQRKVEGRNYGTRKSVLQFDDVMNKQREIIYGQRRRVLDGENIFDIIKKMVGDVVDAAVDLYLPDDNQRENWDIAALRTFFLDWAVSNQEFRMTDEQLNDKKKDDFKEYLKNRIAALYQAKEGRIGSDIMRELERIILLRKVDEKWMDHIDAMEELKRGIYLRSYGQKDPVVEYTHEGFEMFDEMISMICEDTVKDLLRVEIRVKEQPNLKRDEPKNIIASHGDGTIENAPVKVGKKVGRNDPCPCGSGKKYKKCCGKDA